MSHNQHNNQGASGSAPDGYAPVYFGEHENEKNMWVDHLRPAGTAPTVLRGGQMSAETATFVEANHILINDPAWVSGLLETPIVGSLPLLSQPVSYLPVRHAQANDYPAPVQTAQYSDGMHDGPDYNSYGHYPCAGQPGYGYGNPAVAYPIANSITNYPFQRAGSIPWDTYPAPTAPMMPYTNPAIAAPVSRGSRSPIRHQTLPYRRRSAPHLNPIAPSFAPSASGHRPSVPSYSTTSHQSGYPIGYPAAQGHNLATYNGVPARRGAWNFSVGAPAITPYQTRLREARLLAGQQGRFEVGSDDVRNYLPSASSSASNEEVAEDGEHESDEDKGTEDQEEEDAEEDTDHSNGDSEEGTTPTHPIPRKRQGQFHAGNARISYHECCRKHIKCVRPNPNKSCIGCLRAHRGPKVCKITKGSGT
ncbi:hypothetical protein KCU64_g1159, partial [Aureobasidium melanogenum]